MEQFEQFKQNLDSFNGYLSADAEIRYFESGKCKTTFSIPLSKDKESETLWLNCECWGRVAEKASELKKGDEVLIFGSFKEDEYKNKEGKQAKRIIFVVKGIA